MAGLALKIDVELQKLVELRQEMNRLEKEIEKTDSTANKSTFNKKVKELDKLSSQYAKVEKSILSVIQPLKTFNDINDYVVDGFKKAAGANTMEERLKAQKSIVESLTLQYLELKKVYDSLAYNSATGNTDSRAKRNEAGNLLRIASKDLQIEKKALRELEEGYKRNTTAVDSLYTQRRKLREEMALLANADGTISPQNLAKYDELKKKYIDVETAVRRVNNERKLLSTEGSAQLAGIINGISGVTGAFTAFQGVTALFIDDNERLMKIQKDLQAAMSITIGLQQVANTLSATSSFRTQTLTAIQRIYVSSIHATSGAFVQMGLSARAAGIIAKAAMGTATLGISLLVSAAVDAFNKYRDAQARKKEKDREEIELAKQRREAEENVRKSAASSVSSQLVEYKKLQTAYKALGGDINKKKKFVDKAKSSFDQLGVSVTNVRDAENLLINGENAFIKTLNNRALAAAAMDMASEKYKQAIEKMMEAENIKKDPTTMTFEDLSPEWQEKARKLAVMHTKEAYSKVQPITTIPDDKFEETIKKDAENGMKKYIEVYELYQKALNKVSVGLMQNYKAELDTEINKSIEEGSESLKQYVELLQKNGNIFDMAGFTSTGNKEEEERLKKFLKDKENIQNDLLKLQRDNEQKRINLMEEGSEKRRAQIKFNYTKEIILIKQKEEEWRKAQKGNLTDDQKEVLSSWKSYADKNAGLALFQVGQDERKELQETLGKYQSYYQKRLNVLKKFQDEREKLTNAGGTKEQHDELNYQEEQTLSSIDSEFAMREDQFKAWTEHVANLSLEELQRLLVEAERELERMQFLDPENKNLATARSRVTTLKDAVNKKQTDPVKSPDKEVVKNWKELRKVLHGVEKDFRDIGESVGGTVGQIISAAGIIASNTIEIIDGITALSEGSISATEASAGAAAESISTLEKASIILTVISSAMKITQELFNLFGADNSTEKYEKAKEAYESYITILDKVIEKQLELAESLTGDAAVAAYDKAIELIKIQSESARVLGKQYLSSGKSWKSRSKGVYEARDMSSAGWEQAANAMGVSVQQFKEMMRKGMSGLFDLDEKELANLRENAAIFWAQLDSDTQKYAGQIADGYQEALDIVEQKMADFTGLDINSLRNDFHSLISDMDSDSEDFANNFENYLKNAILNSMIKESYADKLKQWREKFAASIEAGTMEQDYEGLKNEAQAISDAMIAERDALASLYGWNPESSSSQESTRRGFETMSQDTASELNGRFTALQMAGEEIKNQNIEQTKYLGSLVDLVSKLDESVELPVLNIPDLSNYTREILTESFLSSLKPDDSTNKSMLQEMVNMRSEITNIKGIVNELRTIQHNGWGNVGEVAENVVKMTKSAPVFAATLKGLDDKFSKEFGR